MAKLETETPKFKNYGLINHGVDDVRKLKIKYQITEKTLKLSHHNADNSHIKTII